MKAWQWDPYITNVIITKLVTFKIIFQGLIGR